MINSYDEIDKKNHVVFANSKNTLITVNNASFKKNYNQRIEEEGLIRKTIKNDVEDEVEEEEEDEVDFDNNKNKFLNREINMQIKRNFKTDLNKKENFKIKITNQDKNSTRYEEVEDMDVEMSENVDKSVKKRVNDSTEANSYSPIQGYRVLVSNLHPNVTEDDILVIIL